MEDKLNILLVDDEMHLRIIIRAYLSIYNVNLIDTDDGEEALSIMEDEDIDLLILDYHMPKMSGDQILNNMLGDDKLSEIPIVMYTAGSFEDEKDKWLKLSTHAFINKQSLGDDLIPTLKDMLGSRLKQVKGSLKEGVTGEKVSGSLQQDIPEEKKIIPESDYGKEHLSSQKKPGIYVSMSDVSSLLQIQSYLKKNEYAVLGVKTSIDVSLNLEETRPVMAIMDTAMAARGIFDPIIKKNNIPPVPFILVRDKGESTDKDIYDQKFAAYIEKPVTEEKLIEVVNNTLRNG